MKIVFLISVFERGGAERQAYLLARELAKRPGVKVEVWGLIYDGEYRKAFSRAGLSTKVIGFRRPSKLWQWGKELARVVRAFRGSEVDVVLPFTTWPNVVVGVVRPLLPAKVLIWGERSAGVERVPVWERIAKFGYRLFVANSTAGVEFLIEEMGVSPRRIRRVNNCVCFETSPETKGSSWRARLGLPYNAPLVLKIANLTESKDHQTLLSAWKIVVEQQAQNIKPVLLLAGRRGSRYKAIKQFLLEENLADSVFLLGSVTDIDPLLRECTLGVFSSLKEGQPNGVLEVMAAGKPVVAAGVPGVVDLLGKDVHQVVKPGDVEAFAEALLVLLKDPVLRQRVGDANLNRAKTNHSTGNVADSLLHLIGCEWKNVTGTMRPGSDVQNLNKLA